MNLLKKIKQTVTKSLVIGGLAITLGGCSDQRPAPSPPILADINKDKISDAVYVRKFYDTSRMRGSAIPHYEILVSLGKVDGNLDISFLREFYDTSRMRGSAIPHYELRRALGNGDGSFKKSEVAVSYGTGRPAR